MPKKSVKASILRHHHIIDATNKSLGRLATQTAIWLQGKNKPSYDHSKDEGDFVKILNINKIKFTGKKFDQKKYYSHSGYPGGIKEKKLKDIFQSSPYKIIRYSVYQMLPKNKLRSKMIKRLTID